MYSVAVVGAGVWAENHRIGWQARNDAKIACVVRSKESSAEETAKRWGVPSWSGNYKEVIARPDIDIVDILLPHDMHADVACEALALGKHVVMEKPVATTVKDAQRIADAAKKADRKIMISENWIYATVIQKAKAAIERGDIGTPYMVRAFMDMDVRAGYIGHWRYDFKRMGGGAALLDSGIHAVSACRYLLGEITEVVAIHQSNFFKEIAPLEDTSVMMCKFASGATGTITVSWTAQRERPYTGFLILGSMGTIEFDTHERQFFVSRDGKRSEETDLKASRGFVEQMAHFIDCVKNNESPITTPEEQIGSLKVVLAAYRSDKEGRFVKTSDIS